MTDRFLVRTIAGMFATGAGIAILLVTAQAPFANATFEYGQYREYQGEVIAGPYPMLLTKDARYLLVAAGKHGFAAGGLDGKRVALRAARIARGPDQMLEVEAGSVRVAGPSVSPGAVETDLGTVAWKGEIVDSKCYLGVMNPGNGKVHRDCAARCIRGGIPPAFLVRDGEGNTHVVLLANADGPTFGDGILPYVAEPVTIHGMLMRQGGALLLRARLTDIYRE